MTIHLWRGERAKPEVLIFLNVKYIVRSFVLCIAKFSFRIDAKIGKNTYFKNNLFMVRYMGFMEIGIRVFDSPV